jgi:hypothetical protein
MAYFLGGTFGAATAQATPATTPDAYDPVYDEPVSMDFIWNVLPSAYRELMQDKEIFTEAWGGMFRYMTGRMLDTWQTLDSFSLATVPVHQQRKWLKYEFVQSLDFYEEPALTRTGSSRTLEWDSTNRRFSGHWANRYGLDKATRPLNGSVTEEGSLSWSITTSFSVADPYSASVFGYFNSEDSKKIANALVVGLLADSAGDVRAFLGQWADAGTLTHTLSSYLLEADAVYQLSANYSAASGIAQLDLYERDAERLSSSTGSTSANLDAEVYTATFIDASQDFDDAGVVAGDYLILDGERYYITAAAGNTLIVSAAALPAGVSGLVYSVEGTIIRSSTTLDLPNQAADPQFTVDQFGTANLDLRRISDGSGGTLFESDAAALAGRRKSLTGYVDDWSYLDPARPETLLSVPRLQDKLTAPTYYWYEGTDYEITDSVFLFKEPPTDDLWAEYSTYDEGVLYKNFGANVGLEGVSSADYRSQVRGLYYAYFKAPTPNAIRTGVQILLGLPIADADGEVEAINEAYSGDFGEVTVNRRAYLYPLSVGTSLTVGDTVSAFQPLCDGVEIKDYLSHPEWWVHLTHDGAPFSELKKYHSFGIFLNLDAFEIDRLIYAANFVNTVKPTEKFAKAVGYKNIRDTVDLDDDLTIVATINLYDIPCDEPALVDYDGAIYEAEEEDWRYDQGQVEWSFTSAAMRATGLIYTSAQLQGVYADTEVRDYLTGIATLTDGDTAATGTGSAWTSEIGSGALSDVYVMAATYMTRTTGETSAGSNTLTDSVTGFSAATAGDTITIDGADYEIQSVDSATEITLDGTFADTETGVNWELTGRLLTWGTVASVSADGALVLDTAFDGTTGTYRLTLMDPDYREALYDLFTETCPEEEVTIAALLSPGHEESLLAGRAGLEELSATVTGNNACDWVNEIGGPGAVSDKYVVTPDGLWHQVSSVAAFNEMTLADPPGADFDLVLLYLADEVLSGSLTFLNGSPTVSCSVSLTGVVAAGDWIQAVPGGEPVVEVDSIDGAGTTITLSASYDGSGATTKAIRRGDSSVLPLTISLPAGNQDFTDWYSTAGGELTDTVPE